MPTYEATHETKSVQTTPDWVYFENRADRDTITLKTTDATVTGGVIKAGVPLTKGTDGFYKPTVKGTKDAPKTADGLLLFDIKVKTGVETVQGVLFTRGTVNGKLKIAEGIALPSTIRVK